MGTGLPFVRTGGVLPPAAHTFPWGVQDDPVATCWTTPLESGGRLVEVDGALSRLWALGFGLTLLEELYKLDEREWTQPELHLSDRNGFWHLVETA